MAYLRLYQKLTVRRDGYYMDPTVYGFCFDVNKQYWVLCDVWSQTGKDNGVEYQDKPFDGPFADGYYQLGPMNWMDALMCMLDYDNGNAILGPNS
jgi:hypothetical protein